MKRAEFIRIWADTVAAGRKRTYPDLRPSEAAVSRMSDEAKAAGLWRKHSAYYRAQTVEQFRAELSKSEVSNG
jgi:hypothetical protein